MGVPGDTFVGDLVGGLLWVLAARKCSEELSFAMPMGALGVD